MGVRDDFFELGGDSLTAMRVAAGAERIAAAPVAPSLLREAATVESFAAALREKSRRQRSAEPLVALETGGPGARPPLFFSPSRDEIELYWALARRLGTAQPFYLARWMHGRKGALPESVEEMAENTVREIRRVQPHGPYRLGGFCFGGVVALDAARQLRAAGEMIALLALVGIGPLDFPTLVSGPASTPSRAAPPESALARFRRAAGRARSRARTSGADFAWRAASRAWRVTGLTLPDRLQDADRVSRRAHAVYIARPDPGPVALFLAERRGAEDPASDYRGLSTAALEIHELPGRDTALFAEPAVGALAQSLGAALGQRGAEAGGAISRRP
jgi:thioesterase domain-containing protein